MPANLQYGIGQAGRRTPISAEFRRVLTSTMPMFLPGGLTIDGTKARDPGNSPYQDVLRAGLILGKLTSGGYYANSIIGVLTNAEIQGSTQIEVSVASAVEIVRRIGATGNLTITGPPSAGGVVRPVVTAYTAVNQLTGAITITATTGVNQVDQIGFNIASTAGNIQLTVQKPDRTFVTTANAAWNATDATYLAAINTQLDAATGVAGGIVASAIPGVDTDLGIRLTYSGTGYAGVSFTPAVVAVFPTSSTIAYYTLVAAAAGGAFTAGSIVGATDGSQTPKIILPDMAPMPVTDFDAPTGNAAVQMPEVPIAGVVRTLNLVDYSTMDSALKTYVKGLLSSLPGSKLIFDDEY